MYVIQIQDSYKSLISSIVPNGFTSSVISIDTSWTSSSGVLTLGTVGAIAAAGSLHALLPSSSIR